MFRLKLAVALDSQEDEPSEQNLLSLVYGAVVMTLLLVALAWLSGETCNSPGKISVWIGI